MTISNYLRKVIAESTGSMSAAAALETEIEANETDITTLEADITSLEAIKTARAVKTTVDASGGGTAEETSIVTLAVGSILLDVVVVVTTAFDGNSDTTMEVGVTGNIDNYIDTTEFDPSDDTTPAQASMTGGSANDQTSTEYITAETEIISTWTNTASATEGSVDVYVIYIPPAS